MSGAAGNDAGRNRIETDVAVIGAGAAGLYVALRVAQEGGRAALISATTLAQTASYWAQGGLAAALAADDSPELHLQDTERAGRGLVRRSAAKTLADEAPDAVHDLQRRAVRFDADRFGRLALGLEGGHSRRRVVHAGGSATGRRVVRQLSALVAEQPLIAVIENARAAELTLAPGGACSGVVLEDGRAIAARAVVIATGGAAALWSRTTNPPGSLGQGLLLALRAGAQLADLEFVQFHPTAVIGVRGREGFLITEAIRGEGATLHDASGERFVDELAPRDEVARAIQANLNETGASSVALDMRAIDPALFPNVVGALREAGLDPVRERIPVAPAAHYVMGGIVCDLHGRSSVPGLFAVGESSCTGLHGANRLASNSLSECFVFGARAALAALSTDRSSETQSTSETPHTPLAPDSPGAPHTPLARVPRALDQPGPQTRESLWRNAGVERTAEGLRALLSDPHPLARLVGACALAREESRGAHTRLDHPGTDAALDLRHTVVRDATAESSVHTMFETWS